jgi:hypothetical protein
MTRRSICIYVRLLRVTGNVTGLWSLIGVELSHRSHGPFRYKSLELIDFTTRFLKDFDLRTRIALTRKLV